MKIDKDELKKKIEDIIAEGVFNAEEVDVTADNVMKCVWPIIDYLKTNN